MDKQQTISAEELRGLAKEYTLLYVEDEANIRKILTHILKGLFQTVHVAVNGEEGLTLYKEKNPDLVITDISMPRMDGLMMIDEIQALCKEQPIIITSAHNDSRYLLEAIRFNLDGYLIKPVDKRDLYGILHKVCTKIAEKRELSDYRLHLEELVEQKTQTIMSLNSEIEITLKKTLYRLGEIAEMRSKETGNHVRRVANFAYEMAMLLGYSKEEAHSIQLAASLHDIGKMAIPDQILKKPGKLTKEEFEEMKLHALYGYEMLKDSDRALFKAAATVALTHHEKWNGEGYPYGLKGEKIHPYGRIVALADVFDALGSERVYKRAWAMDEVIAFINTQKGTHFDPEIVDLFNSHLQLFIDIKERYKDNV